MIENICINVHMYIQKNSNVARWVNINQSDQSFQ